MAGYNSGVIEEPIPSPNGMSGVDSLLSPRRTGPATPEDEAFQNRSLKGVSRTFALTIPQLPPSLSRAVANAYLLCRVADTIEDDPGIPGAEKAVFLDAFLTELERGGDGSVLATVLGTRLSEASSADEHHLIRGLPGVLRIFRSLAPVQRNAVARCVAIMGRGMARFSRQATANGLETLEELEKYCYHVAGVVGEMLTDLFCHHSQAIARRRPRLVRLAVSFGQGLQVTNILKDIWADRDRGSCWLPRRLFSEEGADLDRMSEIQGSPEFSKGLLRLIAIAHGNLRDALVYVQTIPRREPGIRRFLMWAVGLATLTLSRIANNTSYTSGAEVKVSRETVRRVVAMTNLVIRSNTALGLLFTRWARGLPDPVSTRRFVAGLSPDGWAVQP